MYSRVTHVQIVSFSQGDVLSGTSTGGVHHFGVLEGWFGERLWNHRSFVLLLTTVIVFTPLSCFKRVGMHYWSKMRSYTIPLFACVFCVILLCQADEVRAGYVLLQIH